MAVDILYFAWVREAIGKAGETLDPPGTVETIDGLIDWLETRGDGYVQAFADRSRVRAAANQCFVAFDAPLAGVAEVAFFPPVTGG